ncbi:putative ribosome production factor 1 [Aphomia sociella]
MARGKDKKKRKLEKKQEGEDVPKKVPHTLESLREKDETMLANVEAEEQEEAQKDMELDELSTYYENAYEPKVLITYSDNPHSKTRIFGKELTRIIPNSVSRYRQRSSVKRIVQSAVREGVTDVIIVNENQKQPNGFLLIHLPNGPTAHFRLSSCKITPELRKDYKEITNHRPEVILNNFSTRLGMTVGRMLGALFHYEPQFRGRRAVTFHNQRDYIFFRHHRYEFTSDGKRAKLRELGPRFTLKLISLQQGTFDSKHGDYEWIIAGRRHQMETSRRKFFL